ncbi:MAG: hypothetical protein M1368_07150 [Thaumarchaeota archaeon]|nr:hypothetical protein [Nitrososphaerota archaeon]
MRHSLLFIAVTFLALLMVSSISVARASASGPPNPNIGNDNAEFGYPSCGSCNPDNGYVQAEAVITSPIQYCCGNGYVSLQYNPDKDTSNSYQTGPWYGGHDWFQTGIVGEASNNCAVFTVQVYNLFWGGTDYSWYSNGGQCTTVNDMFGGNSYPAATWSIDEQTGGNGKVYAVDFYVDGGSSGGKYYYDQYVPTNWYWLRSNVCWCGTDYQSATFNAGIGTLNYYMNPTSGFGIIGPPIDIATAESSNMNYGCMSSPTQGQLTQGFEAAVGHC